MARVTEESLAGQIRGLSTGQTFSRTTRIAMEDAGSDLSLNKGLAKIRNLINQAVGRIRKEDDGNNFRVESACALTDDKQAVLCTVAVTRFEGTDEEADI